ncbi:MAG: biotin transporter BioY [Candidatus Marinimicrobia bacterium]|nr:biotin transporter BioY [Candidatus Neomarinimicrobiota bacterium]
MKVMTQNSNISERSFTYELSILFSVVLMMAALSRISIPLQPVPVTGQTLGVMLTGVMLGRKRALAAMIIYIGMGVTGFPVFAAGTFGAATLIGPTGGYLLGFIPAAFIMGYLGDKGWYNRTATAIPALLIGHAVIFACGLLWLMVLTKGSNVFALGFLPFIPGAIAKSLIALALIPVVRKSF